jgi:hypothetical protein
VFSFCIYGSNPKYTFGLVKNLGQIRVHYPDFQTWIAVGNDVPQEYIEKYKRYPNVKLIHYPCTGGRLMTYRFFPIDDPAVACMIVRDADSRFGDRDHECIRYFLSSDYCVFTIRDHRFHQCPIMGGQWGIQRTATFPNFQLEAIYTKIKDSITQGCGEDAYDTDQFFTRHYIYPKYGAHMIAFSSVPYTFSGLETTMEIRTERKDDSDFCGNVYEFRTNESGELEEYPVFKVS